MLRNHLLLVDPQNDFCDLPEHLWHGHRPALPVPGAYEDMRRVSGFIKHVSHQLAGITVTLDSHPFVAIERTTFWRTADGAEVAPFTEITFEQFKAGEYVPLHSAEVVEKVLQAMSEGNKSLMVWPVHCVTGTWGHNIMPDVSHAINDWEHQGHGIVNKVLKGQYPLSEHFGVFAAEVPLNDAPATHFNRELAQTLVNGSDRLLVAGEAASHCVAESVIQLVEGYESGKFEAENLPEIILLSDCMSPVAGFEHQYEEFLNQVVPRGVKVMSAAQAAELLSRAL